MKNAFFVTEKKHITKQKVDAVLQAQQLALLIKCKSFISFISFHFHFVHLRRVALQQVDFQGALR